MLSRTRWGKKGNDELGTSFVSRNGITFAQNKVEVLFFPPNKNKLMNTWQQDSKTIH